MKIGNKKYIIGIAIFVLLFLASFQAFMITADKAFMSWPNYDQPYKPILPPVPLIEKTTPLSNHVVIIVIDGARADIVEEANTPNIDWIKKNGVWFADAYCFTPSFSLPGYSTIGTGARPAISGVVSNWHENPVKIDNIFNITLENNGTTALATSSGWMTLFGPWITWNKTTSIEVEADEVIGPWAVELIQNYQPTLLVVHLYDTDTAGHMKASALSDEYKTELEEADVQIGKIIDALNNTGILDETLLIVTSDHGFLNKGHHGGAEPESRHIVLTMRGPGIIGNNVVYDRVYQDLIAEVVCLFLGYRIPTGVTGKIHWEIFNIPLRIQAIYEINMAEIKFKQAKMLIEAFGYTDKYNSTLMEVKSKLDEAVDTYYYGDYAVACNKAEEAERAAEDLIAFVKNLKHKEEVLLRLRLTVMLYIAIIVPIAVCIWKFKQSIDWIIPQIAFICMLGYFIGFWLSFAIQGWRFSVSTIIDLNAFQNGMMFSSIIGVIIGGVVGGFSPLILRKEKPWTKIVIASMLGLLMALSINTIWISIYIVKWNVALDWYFPENAAWNGAVVYYVLLLQNIFTSLFFAITPITAVIITLLLSKTFITKRKQ